LLFCLLIWHLPNKKFFWGSFGTLRMLFKDNYAWLFQIIHMALDHFIHIPIMRFSQHSTQFQKVWIYLVPVLFKCQQWIFWSTNNLEIIQKHDVQKTHTKLSISKEETEGQYHQQEASRTTSVNKDFQKNLTSLSEMTDIRSSGICFKRLTFYNSTSFLFTNTKMMLHIRTLLK